MRFHTILNLILFLSSFRLLRSVNAAIVATTNDLLSSSPRVCEPIRIELCRGIGYNETSMPNLVGHELQTDADYTLQTFSPLIQYGCSAQLHFFLCSAYVPMCTSKVPQPIGPCRNLCETVRDRCHPVLQGFGFPWPAALECSRFPKENNHEHMCMEGPGEPNTNNNNNNNEHNNIGMNNGLLLGGDLFNIGGHNNNNIGLGKVTSSIHHLNNINNNNNNNNNCQGLTKSHLYVRLNRSGKCAALCEADILFDQHEKHIAEMWVTAWSYAALITAILATMCLIFSDTKWDKLLTPLVTCHSLVTVGWTVRFISGRNASACGYDPQLPNISLLLVDGLSNASCAATFLLRYYFGMAAGVWWSILCLEWHRGIRRTRNDLSVASEFSAQGLGSSVTSPVLAPIISNNNNNSSSSNNNNNGSTGNKTNSVNPFGRACNGNSNKDTYSTLSQLAAWGLPALLTGTVLVARLVDADELLGTCFVGNQSDKTFGILVGTPYFCYWIFGSVNLFAGYLVYRRNKNLPPLPHHQHNSNYNYPSHHQHHYSNSLFHNHSHHHQHQYFNNSHHHQQPQQQQHQNINNYLLANMNGVGAFLFIYCIPSGLLLIAVFYEFANSDIWLNLPEPSFEPVAPVKAPMWPFMTRAFMELMLGVLSSAWILGPRISTLYKISFNSNTKLKKYKQASMGTGTTTSGITGAPIKYPSSSYSTASYQTVCQPSNTVLALDKISSQYPSATTRSGNNKFPSHMTSGNTGNGGFNVGSIHPSSHHQHLSSSSTRKSSRGGGFSGMDGHYKLSSHSLSYGGNETIL